MVVDVNKIYADVDTESGSLFLYDTETNQRIYGTDLSVSEQEQLSGILAKRVGVFKQVSQLGTTTTNVGTNTFIALRPPS